MLAPNPARFPIRKIFAAVLRGLAWTPVFLCVCLALVWAVFHVWIVPRISELRPQLQARASQALGIPVRIGSVAAYSTGLVPSFELGDVRLFDPQGHEALVLPRVLVAMSPRSLLSLSFEQVIVQAPVLELRRAANGKLFIAGLAIDAAQAKDADVADWFFSQAEFAIQGGSVRWVDETRAAEPLALTDVNLVVRNGARSHAIRIDATPPAHWGERLTAMAKFRQPLLSVHAGRWQDWEGQAYALASRLNVSQLRSYAEVGLDVGQGQGALRAWVNFAGGRVSGASLDAALNQVSVKLGADVQPLELRQIEGRFDARQNAGVTELSTTGLRFDTQSGLHWPGGNVRVVHQAAKGTDLARTELVADQLDLGVLAQIADRLPIGTHHHALLKATAPTGRIERIEASWRGPSDALLQLRAKGNVTRGSVNSQPVAPATGSVGEPGVPGFRNADIEFDFTESGGHAVITQQGGALEFAGVFEEPLVEIAKLGASVQWKRQGEQLQVQVDHLKFSNADTDGEATFTWKTKEGASGAARFPGVLSLQGALTRGDAKRVHRYLPLVLPQEVRRYVRDSVSAGAVSGVKFRVVGALQDIPFNDPKQGEFKISAHVQGATFAFVPASLLADKSLPWPPLTQTSADLVFERNGMSIKGIQARLGAAADQQITSAEAAIADFRNSTVVVSAQAKGPLNELLQTLVASPVDGYIGHVLARATGNGQAEHTLRLNLPLANLERTTVQGSVALPGNDIQMSPDTPRLARAKALITYSDSGFGIAGGQARLWGGDLRLEGGNVPRSALEAATGRSGPATLLKFQGTASAEGLMQSTELGAVNRLAQRASGSMSYAGQLGFRNGETELLVTSNLQGLALNLPVPLGKTAEGVLPLRVEKTLVRELPGALASGVARTLERSPDRLAEVAPERTSERLLERGPTRPTERVLDQLQVELGRVLSVNYVRDISGPEPRVLRGGLRLGNFADEPVPMLAEGVAANINLGTLDVSAWTAIAEQIGSGSVSDSPNVLGYLPSQVALRAQELITNGRKLNTVVAGVSREGLNWRANVDAKELSGYGEYRQASGSNLGRVFLRLARLTLAPANEVEVESLLDEQPASIPALDIVVDDLELRGHKWGRVEVDAVNRNAVPGAAGTGLREWRLNKFNITTPEAQLTATGNWATINAQSQAAHASLLPRSLGERRRTVMNFKLDIDDAGELLGRFGMKDVVKKGKGAMDGQVSWLGFPFTPDYPSMSGAVSVKVESGQFLKSDPGLAKLLGVLSLQSLPRRLTLDFKDVFSDGFAFDFFGGDVGIEQGVARTNNLQMKGVNAVVFMDGQADIGKETQDIKVVVIPEINAGTASVIATWINPAVGVGTFLAQLFLRRPLIEAATQEFRLDGSWADPKITRVDRRGGAVVPATPAAGNAAPATIVAATTTASTTVATVAATATATAAATASVTTVTAGVRSSGLTANTGTLPAAPLINPPTEVTR